MSNHLHEILEHGACCIKKSDHTLFRQAVFEITNQAKNAVCFDIGDLFEIDKFKVIPELIRLPFSVCWFEGYAQSDFEKISTGIFCYENGEEIVGHVLLRDEQKRWGYWFSWVLHQNGDSYYFGTDNFDGSAWIYETPNLGLGIATVERFLSALHCTNINRIENKPSEKLQKARAKRGKQPLFSYWTLEIDLPKSRAAGEDYGGTHASPRLHLRRGHPRQYAPGKYCWVQPCVVGNKAAGMVHKDYAVHA